MPAGCVKDKFFVFSVPASECFNFEHIICPFTINVSVNKRWIHTLKRVLHFSSYRCCVCLLIQHQHLFSTCCIKMMLRKECVCGMWKVEEVKGKKWTFLRLIYYCWEELPGNSAGCVPVRLLTPQIIIPLRVQHEACSNCLLLSVGKLSTNIMDWLECHKSCQMA